MSGKPALTYTTNVMFRCTNFSQLHDKGLGYRFIFIGPEGVWLTIVAVNGSDRFRMSIVGTPQKINHCEDDIRAALKRAMGRDFDYEILSVMRWVRRELVADRYGTDRSLHRRRRRAPDVADRRLRHEHRHRRRGRSRLEARSRDQGLGRRGAARAPTTPSGARSGCATSRRRAATSSGMLSTRERLPGPEIFAARRGQRRRAQGVRRLVRRDHAARMVRQRRDARLPLRQFADRWPDGTPAPPDHLASLRPDRPTRRPRAACLAWRRTARRSTCSAAALCCCGSAPRRRHPRHIEHAAQGTRRAADRSSQSTSQTCWPPTSGAWCWCGRTAMSRGAPMRSPPMRVR